jgi:CBS domain-containing protein
MSVTNVMRVMSELNALSILVADESVEQFDEDDDDHHVEEELKTTEGVSTIRVDEVFHQYVGAVTVFDIATFIAFQKSSNNANLASALDRTRVVEIIGMYYQLIGGEGFRNGLTIVDSDRPLVDIFAYQAYGCESIYVRHPCRDNNDMHNPLRCISQRDTILYVSKNPVPLTEELLNSTILDAQMLQPIHDYNRLIIVNERDNVRESIRRMLNEKGDALAVLNDSGVLVAAIGPEDVLQFATLYKKGIAHALGESLINVLHEVYAMKIPAPVTVEQDTLFGEALQMLCQDGSGRLFVTDSNSHPIACITRETMLAKFSTAI